MKPGYRANARHVIKDHRVTPRMTKMEMKRKKQHRVCEKRTVRQVKTRTSRRKRGRNGRKEKRGMMDLPNMILYKMDHSNDK